MCVGVCVCICLSVNKFKQFKVTGHDQRSRTWRCLRFLNAFSCFFFILYMYFVIQTMFLRNPRWGINRGVTQQEPRDNTNSMITQKHIYYVNSCPIFTYEIPHKILSSRYPFQYYARIFLVKYMSIMSVTSVTLFSRRGRILVITLSNKLTNPNPLPKIKKKSRGRVIPSL